MSLFSPCPAAGMFTEPVADLVTTVTILRAVGTQQPDGEWLNVFTAIGTVTGALQPMPGRYLHEIGGVVTDLSWLLIVDGVPDVVAGDRAVIAGEQHEVVDPQQWGTHHAEILWKDVGR